MDLEQGRGESETWPGYVDWRNRPALRGKHGGMAAASFVLAVEVMENMAHHACMGNMVRYLSGFMHFDPALASISAANFIGTGFFLSLLGGFLCDAFFSAYTVYLLGAAVELLGLVVLTVQAKTPSLLPPKCDPPAGRPCEKVSGSQAAMLFSGLYLVALGVGGIKGSLPSHGAEQFADSTAESRRQRSTFFNYFVFCLAAGAVLAVTLIVWVEDNIGWQWGFGVAAVALSLSIPVFLSGSPVYRNKIPTGSPFTTIAKVICAAVLGAGSARQRRHRTITVMDVGSTPEVVKDPKGEEEEEEDRRCTEGRRGFLDRALERKQQPTRTAYGQLLACTERDVEDVKVIAGITPIFLSTVMLSCCLAQLTGFSIQQAATMNSKVGSFAVPPASLPIFPLVFIMALAPLYDHVVVPLAREATGTESGVTSLQRIGAGLALSIVAMAMAGAVEVKRRAVAAESGMLDSRAPLPISLFWVAPQFLFLGSSDFFVLGGLLEFFFTEAPDRMRKLATALSYASLALGYYLSSALVWAVNKVSGAAGDHRPWLAGGNLNHYRLENFYWLMSGLSLLNLVNYLFWASRYEYASRMTREILQ